MNIAIQGSKKFDDYQVFMRAMGVALSDLGDGGVANIYTVGPHKVNSFLAGFVNLTEDGMKARGMGIKWHKVSYNWLRDSLDIIDYFIYLSKPKEHPSALCATAERKDIEVGIFRY